ncbi:hypothetical protein [Pseudomonas viridiflava]|uniref:hypothetical protein n=1 Tax=Pseudomonas viridiflava TaxID=33069 RepID=UPI00107039EA|nr:hypothetical protein [Pseudomonas viridiflava]MEE4225625.1 hypothetical protein [Pseudomonas viridiflava]
MPGSFSADTVSPAGNHPDLTTGNEKAPTFTRNVGAFRVSNMAVKEGFDPTRALVSAITLLHLLGFQGLLARTFVPKVFPSFYMGQPLTASFFFIFRIWVRPSEKGNFGN